MWHGFGLRQSKAVKTLKLIDHVWKLKEGMSITHWGANTHPNQNTVQLVAPKDHDLRFTFSVA
jgi:hypothetical protein